MFLRAHLHASTAYKQTHVDSCQEKLDMLVRKSGSSDPYQLLIETAEQCEYSTASSLIAHSNGWLLYIARAKTARPLYIAHARDYRLDWKKGARRHMPYASGGQKGRQGPASRESATPAPHTSWHTAGTLGLCRSGLLRFQSLQRSSVGVICLSGDLYQPVAMRTWLRKQVCSNAFWSARDQDNRA